MEPHNEFNWQKTQQQKFNMTKNSPKNIPVIILSFNLNMERKNDSNNKNYTLED